MNPESTNQTLARLRDPQPGDRFHEMRSFWVHVVGREGERVFVATLLQGSEML